MRNEHHIALQFHCHTTLCCSRTYLAHHELESVVIIIIIYCAVTWHTCQKLPHVHLSSPCDPTESWLK